MLNIFSKIYIDFIPFSKLAVGISISFFLLPFFKEESCNDYYKKPIKNSIEEFLETFSNEHSIYSKYRNSQYEIISNPMTSYNNIENSIIIESIEDFQLIYSGSFSVNLDINFYLETISDYITGSIIPVIIPIYSNKNFNISNEYFRKFLLHKNSINMKLSKGNYQLILIV